MKSICFICTYSDVGGLQTQIVNYATAIVVNQLCHVKVFLKRNSFLDKNLTNTAVNKYYFKDDTLKDVIQVITNEDVLVISGFPDYLLYLRHKGIKVLFWNIYAYSLIDLFSLPVLGFQNKICQRFLDFALSQKGIAFMDDTGIHALSRNGVLISTPESYLPIAIQRYAISQIRHTSKKSIIHICYIGRAVDWKMIPLVKILRELNSYNFVESIEFTIISNNSKKVSHYLSDHLVDNKIFLSYKENIDMHKLIDFLSSEIDLFIGMGTSALDAANSGVASVIVSLSDNLDNSQLRYRWLYDSANYNVGDDIAFFTTNNSFGIDGLMNILHEMMINSDAISHYSELCRDYIIKNHDALCLSMRFFQYCNSTTLLVDDLFPRNIRLNTHIINIRKFYKRIKNVLK